MEIREWRIKYPARRLREVRYPSTALVTCFATIIFTISRLLSVKALHNARGHAIVAFDIRLRTLRRKKSCKPEGQYRIMC